MAENLPVSVFLKHFDDMEKRLIAELKTVEANIIRAFEAAAVEPLTDREMRLLEPPKAS